MKMQVTKFSSINEMLDKLPATEMEIVECLRSLISNTLPNVRERLSYNVPFYFGNRRIVYIWPGSIAWGDRIKEGVEIGFCYGKFLSHNNYLEQNNRQQVFSKRIYRINEINTKLIEQLLVEANEIDELMKN